MSSHDNSERELLLTVAEAVVTMQEQVEETVDLIRLALLRLDRMDERVKALEDELLQ